MRSMRMSWQAADAKEGGKGGRSRSLEEKSFFPAPLNGAEGGRSAARFGILLSVKMSMIEKGLRKHLPSRENR